ncbi:MAG TPA: hypothetical protein VGQ06_13750 [Gemmatimonadales bacterium]|nr:hypothetical protein [Gemmatimonadales bacterium]
MRLTPFELAFGNLARERFPAIAEQLAQSGSSSADRDRFVLLEAVGRLLREIMPADAPAEALDAHVRMLHHAYRHWTAGGWVYRVGEQALLRATGGEGPMTSHLPHQALYLQLPELRVWGAPAAGAAPEPLDGMFVTETAREGGGGGDIAVLGILGMRADRPGFSAVGLDGRADADEATASEIVVAAARADGRAPFSPTLSGGEEAGIYSVETAGELLLLTCRLLALLPLPDPRDARNETRETSERFVSVV